MASAGSWSGTEARPVPQGPGSDPARETLRPLQGSAGRSRDGAQARVSDMPNSQGAPSGVPCLSLTTPPPGVTTPLRPAWVLKPQARPCLLGRCPGATWLQRPWAPSCRPLEREVRSEGSKGPDHTQSQPPGSRCQEWAPHCRTRDSAHTGWQGTAGPGTVSTGDPTLQHHGQRSSHMGAPTQPQSHCSRPAPERAPTRHPGPRPVS